MANKSKYMSLDLMSELMERFEKMQVRTADREWSLVWWRHRASEPEVRTNLSERQANDLRDWCNSLRFGIVCVMHTDLLGSVLR